MMLESATKDWHVCRIHAGKHDLLLAGQALVVGARPGAKVDLRGDDEVGATPVQFLDNAAPETDIQQAAERACNVHMWPDTHISSSELPEA